MSKVTFRLSGTAEPFEGDVDFQAETVTVNGLLSSVENMSFDIPIVGAVYGTLLNYKGELTALADAVTQPPYMHPPKAPVLYIKPQNTFLSANMPIPLPHDVSKIQAGAALGVVIGQTATRVTAERALHYVAGYTIVNDVTVPHDSVFRPAIKHKIRDGFCPIGPWIISKDVVPTPDNLEINVMINGELRQRSNTRHLVRPIASLISDVTEFMTLYKGDTLLVGVPENPPLAGENDKVRIEIEGIGALQNTVVPEDNLAVEGVH